MEFQIDEQLRDLFPPLTEKEYQLLEQNILRDGCTATLYTWQGYIVDGHNRYRICTEHRLKYRSQELEYETKDEVIQWMIETQLGRRNLTPIQKIAITEKYRERYEKKAEENLSKAGQSYSPKEGSANLPKVTEKMDVRKELAKLADVGDRTYGKGAKVLQSDNEDVKAKVLSGEYSIDKGYNEISKKPKSEIGKDKPNIDINKKLSKISNDLSKSVTNLTDTATCDELLSQLEKYNENLLQIKIDAYSRRSKLYQEMPDDSDLTCKIEELITDKGSIFEGKEYVFYIVKSSEEVSNNIPVFSLKRNILILDIKNVADWLEISKKEHKLNDKEFNLLSMTVYNKREEEIKNAEQEKLNKEEERVKREEETKKFWDDFSKSTSTGAITNLMQTIDPEVKDMMEAIIKQGFRELAKKHHPDADGGDNNMMILVSQAKQFLDAIV